MINKIVKIVLTPFLIIISFFCAGEQAPSGGPPDTTPPKIAKTYPDAGTVRYSGNKIAFSFDKYIDRRSLQESFFISPSLGELVFDWSGKEVEISFSDTLRGNTTYIVTLGTDVIDTRKNRLSESYALPFSTGVVIDSASIAGTVINDKPGGVMIFAYRLDISDRGMVNPTKDKPDYLTQTTKNGSFILDYLAYGAYRLIAVADEYKNLIYDLEVDRYGITNTDFRLSREYPKISGVQFRISIEDTTPPFLSSAKFIDYSHVALRFSESMDTAAVLQENVLILDTLTQVPLEVLDLSFGGSPWKEAQIVTAHQEAGKTYVVQLSGFKDIQGNGMRPPAGSDYFTAETNPDTSKPTFEIKKPKSGAINVAADDTIHLIFSESVRRKPIESALLIEDSSMILIPRKFEWRQSRELFIIPLSPLSYGSVYKIVVPLDSVIDINGNKRQDSAATWKFSTVDEKSLSSISGVITDDLEESNGDFYITASDAVNVEKKQRTIKKDTTGHFIFDGLPEGRYVLSAFRDDDANGVYTFGKPFPYNTAERFVIYPDTIKLRARWPIEGVTIRLK